MIELQSVKGRGRMRVGMPNIVQEYCGYGTGKGLHEDPQILNYGRKGTGLKLKAGMAIVIMPMINAGKRHVKLDKKLGWNVNTVDKRLSASAAHTVLVTKMGFEIVTQ